MTWPYIILLVIMIVWLAAVSLLLLAVIGGLADAKRKRDDISGRVRRIENHVGVDRARAGVRVIFGPKEEEPKDDDG